jgi:IS605 OrfB family transposase
MYLTVKQQLKHLTKEEYESLKILCRAAKNLANEALYNIRQYYFHEKKYLCYAENYKLLKSSINYKTLNSNMSQQILREVDESFRSFFSLLKLKASDSSIHCKIPHYLPKDGYKSLVIGFVRLYDGKLIFPFSNSFRKEHKRIVINIPPILLDKDIKEIRIIPKSNARFFEIQWIYKADCIERNLNKNNALAIDFGINNLVTAVTNTGKSFIIDGRRLKSVNQLFNKKLARLRSVKDKQALTKSTERMDKLSLYRNNCVSDYLSKTARKVIDFCLTNDIGTLIVGYNEDFQKRSHMGRINNQNFVNIPFGKLHEKLEYLCELNGIQFIMQEESYTSKASFFDKDEMPVYGVSGPESIHFSGKRIKRGLYKTANGKILNADVNGALNIMRKCKVVSLNAIYSSGVVDTPVRIRIS